MTGLFSAIYGCALGTQLLTYEPLPQYPCNVSSEVPVSSPQPRSGKQPYTRTPYHPLVQKFLRVRFHIQFKTTCSITKRLDRNVSSTIPANSHQLQPSSARYSYCSSPSFWNSPSTAHFLAVARSEMIPMTLSKPTRTQHHTKRSCLQS